MFYGLLDLPWWGNFVAFFIFTHITILSVTLYLHRCQAHRGLEIHPVLSHFFRLWLWLTTGMSTRAWAAIHRKHHAKCETENDPHSPQILGLSKVLWEGAELYRREAKNAETLERYGQGTPEDWLEGFYSRNSKLGVLITFAVDILLFGLPGITMAAMQMFWIPFFAAGVVNGIGHYWGYRNFECPDAARNIIPLGIFIGGEELHNNHHTYPTSAKMSVKWWEVDIGWMYIKLFSALGLMKVKRVAPTPVSIPGKKHVELETLKAIIANRIDVMTSYSKKVILPIFYQEKANIKGDEKTVWNRVKSLLIREDSLVDEHSQQTIAEFIEKNKPIGVAYHFRKQLQAIWDRSAATQKELLDALQDWCQRAEATGIQNLKYFVDYLKGYRLARSQ